ncbi:MAG: primase [Frankiales bacterium]|nr:primase [Frankiales bacterium]
MAGRIREESIALVRERAAIDQVIAEAGVSLRNAGGGRLKGLCPFHDEKTPSFNVNPANGYYMCFGCGESGNVITFVTKHDHMSFPEAVEHLARRYGVDLQYEEGGQAARSSTSQRTRLLQAHKAAAAFYVEQLGSPDAVVGRQFLAERGFDQAAAQEYGVGFAPKGWDGLTKHLRDKGFTPEELINGGLAGQSRNGGLIDKFRFRLMWPIHDIGGEVIGFGARKLATDPSDTSPKYLNTSETPIYKKSSVLYGIDKAKKEIARTRKAVVVEGYTDVMACHLAGVPMAVATCGTAFGADHISVIRRLLMDQDEFRGEVIFTFDGDAAGQKAALKAFGDDQRFVAQTFIAVSPGGMDPCELRLAKGDNAVTDLVGSRVPLVEFAIKAALANYDLESAEGRVQALNAAAPMVAKIKDRSLRPEYARRLAGWLGMEVEGVVAKVGELTGDRGAQGQRRVAPKPTVDAAMAQLEREALKLAVQSPVMVAPIFDELHEEVFTDEGHRLVHETIRKAGGVSAAVGGEVWVGRLLEQAPDDAVRSAITGLAVEAPLTDWELDRYAQATLTQLQMHAATRRAVELKGRLQRINPVEDTELYNRTYGELIALEKTVRAFREAGINGL